MKYGYARVSTDDQNTALQLAALKKAGCKTVFKDEGLSGATTKRPALARCLKALRPGDTLIVWKLDRLGRSLRDLITMLDELRAQGIKFRGIRLRRDSWGSVMYAEERHSAMSSVPLQSTDRHGILGQKPAHFQRSL
jgi:DNA invertase Pin-like site-specific DNA recombinase